MTNRFYLMFLVVLMLGSCRKEKILEEENHFEPYVAPVESSDTAIVSNSCNAVFNAGKIGSIHKIFSTTQVYVDEPVPGKLGFLLDDYEVIVYNKGENYGTRISSEQVISVYDTIKNKTFEFLSYDTVGTSTRNSRWVQTKITCGGMSKKLNINDPICSDGIWKKANITLNRTSVSNHGLDAYACYAWGLSNSPDTAYVAFRIKENLNYRYGWIKMSAAAHADIKIFEYSYQ